MKINERFSANLISSAKLDKDLVPGLETAGTGPDLVKAGLTTIADKTQISVDKATESSDHARPSMLAHLSSFAKNVGDALKGVALGAADGERYDDLSPIAQQNFAEWQGMIAAVALSNIYSGAGLKLSVSPMALNEVVNMAHRCTLLEMHKDGVYNKAVTMTPAGTMTGFLYYICQDGKPFAVFHPQVGLCAMKNYDPSIFEGILPWYKNTGDCHENWEMVIDPNFKVSLLDDFCLRRIQWWAKKNGMQNYADFVGKYLGAHVALDDKLVSPNLMPNAANIDLTWPGEPDEPGKPGKPGKGTAFGSSMAFYVDNAGVAQGLPMLFNDNMLLTSMEKASDNRLVYNTAGGEKPICFSNQPAGLDNVAPVPPFRGEFAALLESCKLEDLDFQAKVVGGELRSVEAQVSLCNTNGEVFHIAKTYDSEQLKMGKLPYMMIWPYIPLPAGMNLWKEFYATWHDQVGDVTVVKKPKTIVDGKEKDCLPMVSHLTFDFGAHGTANRIFRVTAPKEPWTVCKDDKPFQYAMVMEMKDDVPQTPWGMIFLPEYKFYNPGANDVVQAGGVNAINMAVDFGTTSTVCALRTKLLNGGAVTPLPYQDYGRIVTCNDEKYAKKTVDEQHWLGMGDTDEKLFWNRKIFSVAQLFGPGLGAAAGGITGAAKQKYYIDGRMFLISGEAMVNYAAAGKNHADTDSTGKDPLQAQQIMSDMKFNHALDVENTLAASIYLAGVYMYAVLYLLSKKVLPAAGVPYLELRASYPNDVTLGALMANWNNAHDILSPMMNKDLIAPIHGLLAGKVDPCGNPVSQFFSEATATTAYLNGVTNVARANNLISLDIGGGTTDISITSVNYPNTVRKLSFRYAGREIVVSSLIEFFRKFEEHNRIGTREDAFQKIWPKEATHTIMNQFLELTKLADTPFALQNLTDNRSVQMDIELLLSEGMNLGSISAQKQYNLLRQLMALKFLMVMRIVARMVKENLDIWVNPTTKTLDTVGDILDIDLSVSGTSAQVLQYIFDTDMHGLGALAAEPAGKMLMMKQLLEAMLDEELAGKVHAGVKTNLRIYVNPNVMEKREVCFGMLDPKVHNYVITAAGKKFELGALAMDPTMTAAERTVKEAATKVNLNSYKLDQLDEYLKGRPKAGGTKEYGLLDFVRAYENIFFATAVGENLTIGGINTISELLKHYTASFTASRKNVADNKATFMVEKEQEPYFDLLVCTYLVDEILNSEIAKRQ